MQDKTFNHPAWVEIDIAQFKKNLAIIKAHIGSKIKLCLPVKANAYGHGLVDIAKAAVDANTDYLAVSCLQEGKILRQKNIKIPILVLGAIHIEQIAELIEYDLEFTIASHYKARMVADACKDLQKKVKVHLEVDTGMQRTGVRIETAPQVLDYLFNEGCFNVTGVYSHLATADVPDHPFAQTQTQQFLKFLQDHNLHNNPNILCHLSNSAGAACILDTHLDMVRPGLIAFGYYPRPDLPANLLEIKPCFSIKARIAYFKSVPSGSGISYNHTYITSKQSNIITIPVGYGDGLRRSLSNRGAILLNGKRYPMVGTVCMDQVMVDLGSDPGYVGSVVTIVGKEHDQEISIEELSKLCDTIPYEILCGFNDRLPRLYKY
jgi:alanine racemase